METGYKGENMAKVTFDVERCKGCGLCETVCPKQIIALSKEQPVGAKSNSASTKSAFLNSWSKMLFFDQIKISPIPYALAASRQR